MPGWLNRGDRKQEKEQVEEEDETFHDDDDLLYSSLPDKVFSRTHMFDCLSLSIIYNIIFGKLFWKMLVILNFCNRSMRSYMIFLQS